MSTIHQNFYTLIPSGHTEAVSDVRVQPQSSDSDVRQFADSFCRACGYRNLSDLERGKIFYSKTNFILSDNFPHTKEILQALFLEFGLLFEQDFDTLADESSFRAFITNKDFFHLQKPADSSNLIESRQYIQKQYPNTSPSLNAAFCQCVAEIHKKRLTTQQIKHPNLQRFNLCSEDLQLFKQTLWPGFIEHWKWCIWMHQGNQHYKRKISKQHRMQLDQYYNNLCQIQSIQSAYQQWLKEKNLSDNKLTVLKVTRTKCRLFIQNTVIHDMQLTVCDIERSANRMCSACAEKRDSLWAMYQILLKDTGLEKKKAIRYKVYSCLLFLYIADTFSTSEHYAERSSAGHKVWNNLGFRQTFPPREFFLLIMPTIKLNLMNIMPSVKLGVHLCQLLDLSLPYKSEYLAHEVPYTAQSDIVGRFKERYPDEYLKFFKSISQQHDRIRDYHIIWGSLMNLEDRRTFLQRRLRYIKLIIPDDDYLWSKFPPVRSCTGELRKQRIQKYTPEIQLLLFENALQDCVREQAKQHLWELVVKILL